MSKTQPLSLRLPEELIELLKQEAIELAPPGIEISVNQVATKAIREYFERKQSGPATKPKEKKK